MRSMIDPAEPARLLAEAIARYAPLLHLPADINGVALLRAIAAQETSDPTRWAASKHENAYCYGGRYRTPALKPDEWAYGCAVHCSWGPWQIMYPTAVLRGYRGDPVALRDPMVSGEFVVRNINVSIRGLEDATVADVLDAWNSGTARDGIVPEGYVKAASILYQHFNGGLTT